MAKIAEYTFDKLAYYYSYLLNFSLTHRWLTVVFAFAVFVSLPFLYSQTKQELAPLEDQASVLTAVKAPQHANLAYAEHFNQKLDDIYMRAYRKQTAHGSSMVLMALQQALVGLILMVGKVVIVMPIKFRQTYKIVLRMLKEAVFLLFN